MNAPTRSVARNPMIWLCGFFFGIATIAAIALRPKEIPPLPVLATLPAFELKDQDKRPYTLENLKGSISVINFIFTSCPDMCPLLSKQMARLQARATELKVPLKLVSLSVDPETDTPEVLKAYAQKFGADLGNWSFVTGPLESIQKVVIEGFKVAMDRKAEADIFDIAHTEHFVIIDPQARIRAYQRVANLEEIDKLLTQVQTLAKDSDLAPRTR